MAPEVIKEQKFSTKSDVWAVGIILYEICSGLPPFSEQFNPEEIMKKVISNPKLTISSKSLELKSFFSKCVKQSPADRSTAQMLLKDPFLNVNE